MQESQTKVIRILRFCALLGFALMIPAFHGGMAAEAAGSSDDTGPEIDEVTVTSRRIVENLQTTGASIEVFNRQRLDDLGVYTLTDLTNYAPNVTIEAKSGSASL